MPHSHALDRLAAVYRHRRIAVVAFTVTAGLMMAQSYSTTPLYRSSVRLLIQDERSTAIASLNANDPAYWQDPEPYYNTQYRMIAGRGLGRRVVRRLDLSTVPEFNGELAQRAGPLNLIRSVRARVGAAVRALLAKPVAVEPPAPDETAVESGHIAAFLSRVRVEPERGTRLVNISFDAADGEFAALAVNTLAEEYVQQNLDLRMENTQRTLVWLSEELARQQQKVQASENALADYRSANNALSLDDSQNIVVARLNQLNDAATRARSTRIEKETRYNQVKSLDPQTDDIDSFPAIAQSPGVLDLRNRIAQMETEQARLAGRYLPRHPEMEKIATQIEAARNQLRTETAKAIDTMRAEYQAAVSQEASLSRSLEEQKNAAMDLDRKSADYTVLEREAETNRNVYQQLLQQEKELRVIANSRANNVQVMDRADVPGAPFTPNSRRDWMTALLAGLVMAMGLAFGLEYLDDTIKTPEDITGRLQLPLLGLVPAVRGSRVPILSESVPHDFGEAFRSLRTSLVFTSGGESTRIIAVTSTQPLEGKTTTACNLAISLALGGSRVLLIDADMRRPGLNKTMGLPNNVGLSHVLVGQARIRDAIQRTADPNLIVMTAGRTPPNPSELLGSSRMRGFLANLETGPFDWVVIDTPPVLAVTDAVILSPHVSGVVFVIGAEMTRRMHAQRALDTIMASKPRIVGAVLNRVDFDGNKYYYSRYYGYQYKSYYGQAAASA